MRQLLNNLLQLSFDQEDLINDLQNTSYNDPRYVKIAKKQKALQDNAAMIEDSLLALSKRQPKISSTVNREITAINMNMAGAIAALAERQSSEGASRQQFAMTSINNLALILNESLEKMQQEAQSQKPGSGSCNKPGGKGKKPSMAGLRKQQEQLNEQLEKMKEALEKGKKEGSGKQGEKGKSGQNGQSGQGGMSEQLAKLAAEQEYIRRSMQQAAEGLEKNGKMGAKPGGDAAEKMEKTETDLVNRSITPETIKRQQEILNRLLQYEKAEKEQGQDDKRESANPKNELIHQPNSFIEYNKLKEQQVELLKTVPPSLNEYYKAKVNDYFNTFELVK